MVRIFKIDAELWHGTESDIYKFQNSLRKRFQDFALERFLKFADFFRLKFAYLYRERHRAPFTDHPHLHLCTSTFRNSEPVTARFPKFGITFKDTYRTYVLGCNNKTHMPPSSPAVQHNGYPTHRQF